MANPLILQAMLEKVALALGPELCQKVTFVGGCTTGLLLTDDFTKEQVRHTDDVDLIVNIIGYLGFSKLQEQLRQKGFTTPIPASGENPPMCAMFLGDLRVDFMPDDETVLGFSNRWYQQAMISASTYFLNDNLSIRLVSPVYFLATKIEAYKGRGNNDALESRDIEDIIHLVDGREELLREVRSASSELRSYFTAEITLLLNDINFEYAIQSHAKGNADRENLIFERLEALITEIPDDQLHQQTWRY